MRLQSLAPLRFGQTLIVTGPNKETVNQKLSEETGKAPLNVATMASPYGDQFRGRALTGQDVTKLLEALEVPFTPADTVEENDRRLEAVEQQLPKPGALFEAAIGYSLMMDAAGKAEHINLTA